MKLSLVLLAINLVILLQSSVIDTSNVFTTNSAPKPDCLKIGTERMEAGDCLCKVEYFYQYS